MRTAGASVAADSRCSRCQWPADPVVARADGWRSPASPARPRAAVAGRPARGSRGRLRPSAIADRLSSPTTALPAWFLPRRRAVASSGSFDARAADPVRGGPDRLRRPARCRGRAVSLAPPPPAARRRREDRGRGVRDLEAVARASGSGNRPCSKGGVKVSAKYIFVTGGVVSSLGKGRSSIGRLESRELRDAAEDGPASTWTRGHEPYSTGRLRHRRRRRDDLDLGHHERFTSARMAATTTSPRARCTTVRAPGDYWRTCGDHITDEIMPHPPRRQDVTWT